MCWCRFRREVPKVPEGSGVCWCRFRRQLPEGSGGNFRKVPEGSGEFKCFGRLSRVSVWFVALQP